jgi:diacylglycerol kinase (ATP)
MRCNDSDSTELSRNLRKRGNTRAINSIVITHEDAHPYLACKGAATSLHRRDAMRICLYWNKTAGGGIEVRDLTSVITRAGHTVVRDIEDASELPTDLSDVDVVVAAGGDGTIARAGRALAGGQVPLAIFPMGTANNIASSLDIRGEIADIARRWHLASAVKVDVGVVHNGMTSSLFLESVGCGLVTTCIQEGRRTLSKDDPDTHLERARQMYLDMLRAVTPRRYRITLDDEAIDGEFLLVEALNTPSVGPRVELTGGVNVADGFLSVVAIDVSERDQLASYLSALQSDAAARGDFRSWRARKVQISGSDVIHVDDQIVNVTASPIALCIRASSLAILA